MTLPCLRPTTFFVTVILTIDCFKVFDLILVMTNGGPGTVDPRAVAVHLPDRASCENQFGYASAVSIVLFLICIVVTIIQFLVNKRGSA